MSLKPIAWFTRTHSSTTQSRKTFIRWDHVSIMSVSPSSRILTTFISRLAYSYRSLSILALCNLAFFSSVISVPRHSPILSTHLLSDTRPEENKTRESRLESTRVGFWKLHASPATPQIAGLLCSKISREKKKKSGHLRNILQNRSRCGSNPLERTDFTHQSKRQILTGSDCSYVKSVMSPCAQFKLCYTALAKTPDNPQSASSHSAAAYCPDGKVFGLPWEVTCPGTKPLSAQFHALRLCVLSKLNITCISRLVGSSRAHLLRYIICLYIRLFMSFAEYAFKDWSRCMPAGTTAAAAQVTLCRLCDVTRIRTLMRAVTFLLAPQQNRWPSK